MGLHTYIPAVGVLLKAARESTKQVDVVKPTILEMPVCCLFGVLLYQSSGCRAEVVSTAAVRVEGEEEGRLACLGLRSAA